MIDPKRGCRRGLGFIAAVCVVACSLFPAVSSAGSLETGDGFFYGSQYEKAITAYTQALGDDTYDARVKTNIKYKIGLSYYLLSVFDKAVEFWTEAKRENPGIFDGRTYRIPVGSMEPQLIKGDYVIVDNEYYKHKAIARGDVAVFLNPADSKHFFVKRVMALPGDNVEIRKKELFINGRKALDNVAKFEDEVYMPRRDDFGPAVMPEKSYFVLGDNRDKSLDSRFFGPVPEELFVGKALVIYGSLPTSYSAEGQVSGRVGMKIK